MTGSVIISYPGKPKYTGGTVTTYGGNTIHTFSSADTLTPIELEWRKWFAWYPRRVNKKWYWLNTAYRAWDCTRVRAGWGGRDGSWRYGDIFDVIRGGVHGE